MDERNESGNHQAIDVEDELKQVRAALQYNVAQICTNNSDGDEVMTKGAIHTLAELTYLYATTSLANDLVSFSQHANRRTITTDDVLLVARKDPDVLQKRLLRFAQGEGLNWKTTKSNHLSQTSSSRKVSSSNRNRKKPGSKKKKTAASSTSTSSLGPTTAVNQPKTKFSNILDDIHSSQDSYDERDEDMRSHNVDKEASDHEFELELDDKDRGSPSSSTTDSSEIAAARPKEKECIDLMDTDEEEEDSDIISNKRDSGGPALRAAKRSTKRKATTATKKKSKEIFSLTLDDSTDSSRSGVSSSDESTGRNRQKQQQASHKADESDDDDDDDESSV